MCGWSLNATFCPFLGLCATADQLLRRFRRPLYIATMVAGTMAAPILTGSRVSGTLGFRGRLSRVFGRSRVERWGSYFLRITRRLRRGRSLRPRGGSGSVGAITFAFSLL